VRKITALIILITLMSLFAGCGQAIFAEIESRGYFYEEIYEEEFATLGLDLEVRNLTGDTLYIEDFAASGESGEKQILISLVSDQGKEHKPQYYDVEGISYLPTEAEPNRTARGYVVFTDLPPGWSVVTLAVEQKEAGDKEGKVIYTEEITKESVSS
jgi:hypothetical protein